MTKEIRIYEDDCIFNGIYEYYDENKRKWRAEDCGSSYKFYKKKGDSFLFEGELIKRKKFDCLMNIHQQFLNTQKY